MVKNILLGFFLSGLFAGCATYKQNIMFVPGENFVPDPIKTEALKAEHNYIIQRNDLLTLEIYTNNGERLIDPNPELSQTQTTGNEKRILHYLVDSNGVSRFPMVGELKVEGLTLRQAELVLQKEYERFFKSPYITLGFENKRIIVLGAPGGMVIPLVDENITLAEVLALAKGISSDGKAHNIRVLRDKQVFFADFSTIEGFHKANMIIEPGDIVYIEPLRKPFVEGFRDYSILITFILTITSFLTIFTR